VTEKEFIESIDCQFPYFDRASWQEVIKVGCQISPKAAFAVLDEICRPPLRKEISVQQLEQILEYWKVEFHHPLAEPLGNAARLMINREEISVEQAVNLLNLAASYPHLYSALNVPYFACDDTDGFADKIYNKIIQRWRDVESS
jgi:hypothetical protein